jgi:hypothetical protein
MRVGVASDLDDATSFGGHGEDFATRCEDGAAAVGSDVDIGEVVKRGLDPVSL